MYVPFLNAYSDRMLPGTDFLASRDKDVDVYRTELEVTSRINRYLSDAAFRNIALGENYFRLLALEYDQRRKSACAQDSPSTIWFGRTIHADLPAFGKAPFADCR